ncbi:hypothetical protein CPB85DRAFT_1325909 [Mucidula mucida]|nr:hypothetical protein CPB85DRAFT_1325909 [Mucidula mucida]
MSDGGLRNHSFGNLICDDRLQLMYYDHSCIAVAKPLNMRADRRMLMLYLVCLHKLSLSDRSGLPRTGILENPKPYLENYSDYVIVNEDWYNILSGQVLLLEDQTGPFEVTLGRVIDRQTGIIGRCTFIVNATCTMRWPGIELIVKITWSPTSRTSEADFIRSVREAVSTTGADWVLDHVPNILHSQDFPHLQNEVGGRLAAFLNTLNEDHWTKDLGAFKYEERVMRVSVHEKLYKLSELNTVRNHAQVFFDVVQVHRWLYDHPRILHRDISLGNIMWRRRRARICGVLNDFDLSSFRDTRGPSSKQRTGTRPFMSRDLHRKTVVPTRHLYRHDLESLFYVLLLLAGAHRLENDPVVDSITQEKCYLVGDENSPYRDWLSLDDASILREKDALLESRRPLYTHPSFQVLNSRIGKARVSLLEGFNAQRVHIALLLRAEADIVEPQAPSAEDDFWSVPSTSQPAVQISAFDDETLGEKWTYTGLLDCIGAGLPFERMYPVPRSE